MARNSADVVDHEVDAMLSAVDPEHDEAAALAAIHASWFDESERTDVLEPRHLMSQLLPQSEAEAEVAPEVQQRDAEESEQRPILRAAELPPSAAEDPRWDDERDETFAADLDHLAPWQVPDLSDAGAWEEAKTAYFERTSSFELLDAKFVREYTDRLPGGLSELLASDVEPANPVRAKPDRRSGVRQSARVLPDSATLDDAWERELAAARAREQSVDFAYQVSPADRASKTTARSVPASPTKSGAPTRNGRAAAGSKAPAKRRIGSETTRSRGRAAARTSDPIDFDPDALEFEEASVATVRGGRRFVPKPKPTPTLELPSHRAPTVSRRPAERGTGLQPSAAASGQWLVSQPTPDPTNDPATFRALAAQSTRPSAQPGALAIPAGLDSDFAELREHRRHQTAAWIWYSASALAAVGLIFVVRAWTNTGATITEGPPVPSVALETAVNAASEAETGFAITSHPEGAQIFVDGKPTGFLTPARVRRLSPGLHAVDLKLAGYYDTNLPATLSDNTMLELASIEMRQRPAEQVASAPVGGIVPPLVAARQSRRERREARRAHHHAITKNAPQRGLDDGDIGRGSSASAAGTLRINSRPWARVMIDNKFVGNTPQRSLKVAAGEHSVKLVNEPLGMSKTIRVTVHEGETVTRVEMLNDDQ